MWLFIEIIIFSGVLFYDHLNKQRGADGEEHGRDKQMKRIEDAAVIAVRTRSVWTWLHACVCR